MSENSSYNEENLKITIAMTLKNSSHSLEKVLENIVKIDYPKKLIKLVFIDGGSTDNSVKILNNFSLTYTKHYYQIFIDSKPVGITEGRNLCLKEAMGEIILFIDSDVLVPPSTIKSIIEQFKKDSLLAFINVPCLRDRKTWGYLDKLFFDRGETMGMSCAAMRLEALKDVGQYFVGTSAAENALEIMYRFKKKKYNTINAYNITALHLKDSSATIKQYIMVSFLTASKLHLPLLKMRHRKIVLKYLFYIGLIVSSIIAYWSWIPLIFLLIIGGGYHLAKSKGNPLSVFFLIVGIVLVIGVIKEVFASLIKSNKKGCFYE
ncbi:MAG: glycosyltransferase [Thermoproteota archaeon]